MKATQVGKPIPGKFNFSLYLKSKYEGFFPESLPTIKEINQVTNKQEKFKMLRRYNGVMAEWAKLQKV